jgi:hypothetical protein
MGMTTHVYGFRPPDDEWRRMKEAYDACAAANIEIPDSIWRFFGDDIPDEAGVSVPLGDAVKEYKVEMDEGFEVDLTALPPGLKIIRFVNSY